MSKVIAVCLLSLMSMIGLSYAMMGYGGSVGGGSGYGGGRGGYGGIPVAPVSVGGYGGHGIGGYGSGGFEFLIWYLVLFSFLGNGSFGFGKKGCSGSCGSHKK